MPNSNSRSIGRIGGPLLESNLVRNGRDLAFENDLLYFDVTSGQIGIRRDTPDHQLSVSGTSRFPHLDIDQFARIDNITINNSEVISPVIGDIRVASPLITVDEFLNLDDYQIKNNEIKLTAENTDVLFDADGAGTVNFLNDTLLEQTLRVENSTFVQGNTQIGTSTSNSVTFNSLVDSDIVPAQDGIYDLGKSNLRWQTFETNQLNGEDITVTLIDVGEVDIGLLQGNILYVAQNGTDRDVSDGFPNSGVHQQAPWRTIKYALSRATAGDTVYIFPGTYQEQLPLTVPAGVAVRGQDLRNTIVEPAAGFEDQDVFLIDGETTVSDLTVKNFFYNSVNNTGHAFRFVSGGKVTNRSPYVQNISVITKGSVTTAEDPRGFAAGDAGRGAWIDGAEFDESTNEASLLFHSVTFITPGVDCVTMTNGVRVEWLNSFIYFADRGLVALQGSGRVSADGSTLRFGAELRAIGSANIYGNIGAVADGEDTLMYLINHNFSYIGSGQDSTNDPTLAIQDNETQEFNDGKIYFQSQAHDGNFRVGDVFFANQATGQTSIDLTDIAVLGLARLTVTTNGNVTILDSEFIETGNIRFRDNTARSLTGDININSASGLINYLGDVNIEKNLTVSNDLLIAGDLIGFGDQITDIITFDSRIVEDVKPTQTEVFNLGADGLLWKTVWTSTVVIDQTRITNSTIETKDQDATLELKANGSGLIEVDTTDAEFGQDLTVGGIFYTDDVEINAGLTQTGNRSQSGDYSQIGNTEVDGTLAVSSTVDFENIKIDQNQIEAINNDLVLKAQKDIAVDQNDVVIQQDLTVRGLMDIESAVVAAQTAADEFYTSDIQISSNQIQTTENDQDLVLASTQDIVVPQNNVVVDNDLDVNGDSDLDDLEINNSLTHVGDRIQTGDYSQTGNSSVSNEITVDSDAIFEQIEISQNQITTTATDQDLLLKADGLGSVRSAVDTVIQNNLTVNGVTNIDQLTVETFVNADTFKTSDIEISANQIKTYTVDQDLKLESTDGFVDIENIEVEQNTVRTIGADLRFQINEKFVLSNTDVIVVPRGTTQEKTQFNIGDFRLDTTESVFEGYYTSRVGFGGVFSDDKQTSVTAHPFDDQLIFTINSIEVGKFVDESDRALIIHRFTSEENLFFRDNLISTQEQGDSTLQNLELATSGTGRVVVDDVTKFNESQFVNLSDDPLTLRNTGTGYVAFVSSEAIMVPFGPTVDTQDSTFIELGDTRWNTDLDRLEIFDGENYVPAAGAGETVTSEFMQDLSDEWSLILG